MVEWLTFHLDYVIVIPIALLACDIYRWVIVQCIRELHGKEPVPYFGK
jgi:hypothetical protein